jgi:hypothetical protein
LFFKRRRKKRVRSYDADGVTDQRFAKVRTIGGDEKLGSTYYRELAYVLVPNVSRHVRKLAPSCLGQLNVPLGERVAQVSDPTRGDLRFTGFRSTNAAAASSSS